MIWQHGYHHWHFTCDILNLPQKTLGSIQRVTKCGVKLINSDIYHRYIVVEVVFVFTASICFPRLHVYWVEFGSGWCLGIWEALWPRGESFRNTNLYKWNYHLKRWRPLWNVFIFVWAKIWLWRTVELHLVKKCGCFFSLMEIFIYFVFRSKKIGLLLLCDRDGNSLFCLTLEYWTWKPSNVLLNGDSRSYNLVLQIVVKDNKSYNTDKQKHFQHLSQTSMETN